MTAIVSSASTTPRRVVVFDSYPLDVGGTHRLIEQLAHELRSFGWTVRAAMPAMGPAVEFLRDAGVQADVIEAPRALLGYGGSTTGGRALLAAAALPAYWAKARPFLRRHADVVAAIDLRGLLLCGPAARVAGRPLLWWITMYPRTSEGAPRDALGRPLSRLTHSVTALSAPLLEMSVRGGEVIPPPVYPAQAHDGPKEQPPMVASIARIHPQKGVDVLVEASRLLRDRGVDHSIAVVGSGRGDQVEKDIRRRIADAHLESTVKLLGVMPDVSPVLHRASLYVQSSRTAEGFGMAAQEAMAHGLPVIATDVGGLRQLVGEAGVLVPPDAPQAVADAVEALLGDPERRARLGEMAVLRSRQNAPDIWAGRMAGLLERTLARP